MWLAADAELHGTVFAMADNARALNILNNLNDQWHRVRAGFVARTGRRGRSVREHTGFVEAILSGDPDLAEKCMREHLHRLRDELVNILVAMVLPFVEEGV